MATTKVIADLTDLNKANTTKSLKMPSGGAFSGTVTEGMLRNDTSQSSNNSASTMQFYNGTEWKNFTNLSSSNPFNASIYLNPNELPSSGTISEWTNSGTNGHVATPYGNSGSISVDTLGGAKCAKGTFGAGNQGFAMNPSGTTGLNKYSIYPTQQNFSWYGFMAADSSYTSNYEYPILFQIGNSTGSSNTDYGNTLTHVVWRIGLSYSYYIYAHLYDSSLNLVTTSTTTETAQFGLPYPTWTGVGLTHEYNSGGVSYVKIYKNGSLIWRYSYSATWGQSSNALGFGISYYPNYNYGGMYYGDINYWQNELKSDSEIQTVHDYFKATYGL